MPDFTVITPNLDYGRYLGDCLGSVADQDGVDVEHLVMDGGSTDDSARVAAGFPQVVWDSRPDGGMSEAINRGFGKAAGRWVMWLNADDRLKPGALAEVLEFAESRPETDVIYGAFDFVDEAGSFQRRVKLFDWSRFVSVQHCCYVPSTACFLKKETVLDAGHRLREDFRFVMDGEFHARLADQGLRFSYLPVALADFRLHPGNLSRRHDGRTLEMDEILRQERQHVESRAIRRRYGWTPTSDPYWNGLADGVLYGLARCWKGILKATAPGVREPR